LLYR